MYDVIVVGGGIGGAAAAYFLRRRGLKVLVLEKERLPRYKPCAGGVPRSVLRFFPFPFDSVIEREISAVRCSFRGQMEFSFPLPSKPVVMVMRDSFDHFVVHQSQAHLLEDVKVVAVHEDEEGVIVVSEDGREFRGRYLVGADGASSVVARELGLRKGKLLGVALEAEVPAEKHVLERYDSEAFFLFGLVRWGYLWIFPKKRHLSVGIGAFGKSVEDLRRMLLEEMERRGVALSAVPLHAHPLPVHRRRERLHSRRSVLVGDAAGLMDPLLGEGIRHAVRSAYIAAEALGRGNPAEYTFRVQRIIGANLRWALVWARVFYNQPKVSYHLGVRNPYIICDFARMFNEEIGYGAMMLRIPLYAWGVLKMLW